MNTLNNTFQSNITYPKNNIYSNKKRKKNPKNYKSK